jgi:hypothetical protein
VEPEEVIDAIEHGRNRTRVPDLCENFGGVGGNADFELILGGALLIIRRRRGVSWITWISGSTTLGPIP